MELLDECTAPTSPQDPSPPKKGVRRSWATSSIRKLRQSPNLTSKSSCTSIPLSTPNEPDFEDFVYKNVPLLSEYNRDLCNPPAPAPSE
ncbi:hypothetical protein DSO57_1033833 [Entomophthora muscae]|uniref:Uncharacterized protein n=1 Tax=Entomophthora muscae TaxID=34485 RepID=A0ACC2REV4_9FUNG|nr:hypothetical protein DSO57_1033833 [Entomophthora muscae]